MQKRRIRGLLLVSLALVPRAAWTQGNPVGSEFRINTFSALQADARLAKDPAGRFVVVWHSYTQDGSKFGVFGQRYDDGGAPLGAEFRVNTYTTSNQGRPAVASDAAGNFVVVWDSAVQDAGTYGIEDGIADNCFGSFSFDLAVVESRLNLPGFDTGGRFRVRLDALPNRKFVLETSSDLKAWTPWQTQQLTSASAWFTNTPPLPPERRFYHAVRQ